MKSSLTFMLLIALAAPALAAAPVTMTELVEADGTRTLTHEVVIDATGAQVWEAFTTEAGWRSWAVPFAKIDWRIGGDIETSYNPAALADDPANIRNRILAYLPGKMIAIQAVQAPPGFPNPELLPGLWSVIELAPAGDGRTRVRLSGLGYAKTPGHDQLYGFFKLGNAQSLEALAERFETGPVNWAKKLKKQSRD